MVREAFIVIGILVLIYIGTTAFLENLTVINASGNVFLLTPSGKINLGDYVGEYSADKNQTVWVDKNGSKHMTTAAVEFIESKK